MGVKIHVLDTRHGGRPGIIAATALETNDGIALFDTGADSTFANIAAAMRAAGFAPNDVRHVFLSHIHLDHAGAAWHFAELGATIHVHPRGARHLVDPSRLMESATRIFGDDMQRLWGEMRPIAEDKVKVTEDGEIIRAGEYEGARSRHARARLASQRLPMGTTIFLAATSPGCNSMTDRRCRPLFRRSCMSNHGWNRSTGCARCR